MVRNRPRFIKGSNPNNLHVIPTASVHPSAVIVTIPPLPQVENNISVTPTDAANKRNFYSYKKAKKKRNRLPKKSNARFATRTVLNSNAYRLCNPKPAEVPVDNSQNADPPQGESLAGNAENNDQPDKEKENVAETTAEDVCFEEVEVASSEGESKHIPVGFRKTKLCYLYYYKRNHFFKPKFYKLCSQRTVVNCLNVEDNVSVDIDIVSEAEYDDEPDNMEPDDSAEKHEKIVEIEEEGVNDLDDNVEEKVEVRKDAEDQMEEKPAKDIDNHVSEEEIIEEYENHREDLGSDIEIISEDESPKEAENEMEVEESTKNAESQIEKKADDDDIEFLKESFRTYKTCIKTIDGFNQGKSLIQNELDSWMSHLIGLEYLVEIQNKNGDSVLKYYCALCCEDLEKEELPEVPVINHVNGKKHIMKFLEKHFSSCGYKYDENSSNDFVSLQKLCEKINENLGYYFMCFTNVDYFTENNEQIKNVICSSYHPNEEDFKFDKSSFEKSVECDLSLDIRNILKGCLDKVASEEEEVAIICEIQSKKVDKNKPEATKAASKSVKTEDIKTKTSVNEGGVTKKKSALDGKHKGNNPISAFLRLRFAANKLPSHVKKPSNKSKEAVKKTEDSMKETKNADDRGSEKSSKATEVVKSNKLTEAAKAEVAASDEVTEIADSHLEESDQVVEVEESDQVVEVEESDQVVEVEESEQVEGDQMIEGEEFEQAMESTEALESGAVESDNRGKVHKLKQKFLVKTSVHSKHCRKISVTAFYYASLFVIYS